MMSQNPQMLVDALKSQQQQQNQSQPSSGKSSRVCRHFVRGRCTWGAACRFSHEADRAGEVSDGLIGMLPSPKVSSPTYGNPGAGGHLSQGQSQQTAQQTWIGAQQSQLQQQRNAILRAAMEGQFAVRPIVGPDGQSHHTIHLTTLPSPEIAIQLLPEPQLRHQLHQLELDDRVRESGLHYLIGEPSVFWSMIRHWHQTGSTSSAKWDAMLSRARQTQQVDCMFYRSAAGCLSASCPFEHAPRSGTNGNGGQSHVLSMATSNALLQRVPSLGFGSSNSQDRLSDLGAANVGTPNPSNNNAHSVSFTAQQLHPIGGGGGMSAQGGQNSTAAAALFRSSPTLDELAAAAAAASSSGDSWHHSGSQQNNNMQGTPSDDAHAKSIWSMLSVAERQPVAVTTAPSSHSIW